MISDTNMIVIKCFEIICSFIRKATALNAFLSSTILFIIQLQFFIQHLKAGICLLFQVIAFSEV
ncbi:hypothetical protein ACH95_06680 [Bacillus glycinifermentans]|nr:hypothetical protein ACH95_06680 [Bacillus glycinifermentans]